MVAAMLADFQGGFARRDWLACGCMLLAAAALPAQGDAPRTPRKVIGLYLNENAPGYSLHRLTQLNLAAATAAPPSPAARGRIGGPG